MTDKPLISVIIPVFNHARALEKSLRTLCEQKYRPIEALIIDDGSTDNLQEVISGYIEMLSRAGIATRFITQKNQGAAAARNVGIQAAQGTYLICWDADTIADRTMLEKLEHALSSHSDNAFSYCSFRFGWKTMRGRSFDISALRKVNYIDTTTLVRSADMILFDPTLKRFQDWDVWLTLAAAGKKGIFVPETLFSKIVHGRKGYSAWFPAFFLRLPWKTARVKNYEVARSQIIKKHHL